MRLLYYIIVSIIFVSCTHTKPVLVNYQTKDSVYYNIIHKDTTVYHYIEADTLKATQNVNLDNLGDFRDTISVLSNNYSTSIVELSRLSQNDIQLNHLLLQKKLKIEVPVKFVYLDKYITKYEYKEIPVEVIVEKPIRDKLFWLSIIGNIIGIFFLILLIKFK